MTADELDEMLRWVEAKRAEVYAIRPVEQAHPATMIGRR